LEGQEQSSSIRILYGYLPFLLELSEGSKYAHNNPGYPSFFPSFQMIVGGGIAVPNEKQQQKQYVVVSAASATAIIII